jgi:hypothetical protein
MKGEMMKANKVQCGAEITSKELTLYCTKRPGHKGWHLNDAGFQTAEERKRFAKLGKVNKEGDFRWPQIDIKRGK